MQAVEIKGSSIVSGCTKLELKSYNSVLPEYSWLMYLSYVSDSGVNVRMGSEIILVVMCCHYSRWACVVCDKASDCPFWEEW
jgi:hypothetical protein